MLDDFMIRALIAGTGLALIAGPLGCFVVWRRMAYFGDTLSHSALLGVALGLLLEVNLIVTVLAVSVIIAVALLWLQSFRELASDTLLGLLSHSALALGLLVLAFMTWVRIDITSLLIGDILSVSRSDLVLVWLGGAAVMTVLIYFWRPLFVVTVSEELARAEGVSVPLVNFVFAILLAVVIALAIEIIGVLLITALLIIPAATARRLSSTPEMMAVLAAVLGVVSVVAGLMGSVRWDTPSGPSIVVAALLLFIISLIPVWTVTKGRN